MFREVKLFVVLVFGNVFVFFFFLKILLGLVLEVSDIDFFLLIDVNRICGKEWQELLRVYRCFSLD